MPRNNSKVTSQCTWRNTTAGRDGCYKITEVICESFAKGSIALLAFLLLTSNSGCFKSSENRPREPERSYREYLDNELAQFQVDGAYNLHFQDPDSTNMPLLGECEVDILFPVKANSDVLLVIHVRMRHQYEDWKWRLFDVTGQISACRTKEGTRQQRDEVDSAKRLVGRSLLLNSLADIPKGVSLLRTQQTITDFRRNSDSALVVEEETE